MRAYVLRGRENLKFFVFFSFCVRFFSGRRISDQVFLALLPLSNFCSEANFALFCLGMFFFHNYLHSFFRSNCIANRAKLSFAYMY